MSEAHDLAIESWTLYAITMSIIVARMYDRSEIDVMVRVNND